MGTRRESEIAQSYQKTETEIWTESFPRILEKGIASCGDLDGTLALLQVGVVLLSTGLDDISSWIQCTCFRFLIHVAIAMVIGPGSHTHTDVNVTSRIIANF